LTLAACHAGVAATLEKPPPDVMSAPVAVDATISVPEPAHLVRPLGVVTHMSLLGLGSATAVPFLMAVAPTARM
jgi:hypothetical protein